MFLRSISYCEFANHPQEWRVDDLELGPRNLIVGKNSSGKSRTLAVIGALARNLSGLQPASLSADYKVVFDHDGVDYQYNMVVHAQEVIGENIVIDGKTVLSRGPHGYGKIIAEKISLTDPIDFQTPINSFAAFARRDSVQHSFLEPLASWADSLRYYHFAGNLGKFHMAAFVPGAPTPDDREEHAVTGLFRVGLKQFGSDFVDAIKRDLAAIDYPVDDILTGPPISVSVPSDPAAPALYCLLVKETGLNGYTDQFGMSDGMYRVVALLIHVNLALFRKSTTTLLVDDIGEGLDFDRSTRLIELLRGKATASNLQLVMSTNDRFVMNGVPLEEWTLLHRRGQTVEVKNYKNSKDHFDQFSLTGLSNFSFFEMNVDELSEIEDDEEEEFHRNDNRGGDHA